MEIMDRIILHCDLNNFYASVECLKHPEWRNVPLAVSGNPEKRHGVVLAKNEIAKSYGIKTGDVIWQAQQKAPSLVLVEPHFDDYMRFSKTAFELYTRYTCYVEPFGADECWLDCTGSTKLFGSGEQIAEKIRKEMYDTTGLTLSVGVSFNKIFAKLGSDLKKPDATTVISRENFKQKVWPLPACEMMMIGRKTYDKLLKLNVRTIGDLANFDVALLKAQFGINGVRFHECANGEDREPVREYEKTRKMESIGHGMTAVRDITDYGDAETMIFCLSEMVAERMRKNKVRGCGVNLCLRTADLHFLNRQCRLTVPSFATHEIAEKAIKLLRANWDRTQAVRMLAVSVFDLMPLDSQVQMTMFDDEINKKEEALEMALDSIREKYGKSSISRANLLGKDFIYDKTEAEDFLPFQR